MLRVDRRLRRAGAGLLLALLLPAGAVPRVGMIYEGWHAPAFWGRSLNNLTVEGVVRSNGSRTLGEISAGMNNSASMSFWWHKQPQRGFYCIYRKRPTENVSSCGLPDCPGITDTLTAHARMLRGASVDFIVAESTNIQSTGPAADALQLRPWEVLGEEWLALRKAGIPTPQIAIWQNLQDPAGNLWSEYVNGLYADPAYDELIFTDNATGKKVLFTTANPTQALVDKIEAAHGGTIRVVTMWAERMNFEQGEWTFFSPCTVLSPPPQGQQVGDFTSSVYSSPEKPCAQHLTTNSRIGAHGTSLTVGPSYQLSYSSLPFQASGKLGGLTLKKQFERAFEENAKGTLDYLMVGTFNEHVAQPQPNKYQPWVRSMGLPSDPAGSLLWVDMYGDGVTRDLEPTVEDNGALWGIFESCMRVFRSGVAACADDSVEPCCVIGDGSLHTNRTLSDPLSSWLNVWSLRLNTPGGDDQTILTVSEAERASLLIRGWTEVCSATSGSSAFCSWNVSSRMAPNASAWAAGPFLLRGLPLEPNGTSMALHRCVYTAGSQQRHYVSLDPECRGQGTSESVLGYTARSPSSDTPRSLRLCATVSEVPVLHHALDGNCGEGEKQMEHLGFVH